MRRRNSSCCNNSTFHVTDYGPEPFVVNLEQVCKQNKTFRTALWTGEHLQNTVMCIPSGGDIGLESHPHLDQFLYIEEGTCNVRMGAARNRLNYQQNAGPGCAIYVPAGTWHNLICTSKCPLKLFSIYSPPQHPWGTVHTTKAIAESAEEDTLPLIEECPLL